MFRLTKPMNTVNKITFRLCIDHSICSTNFRCGVKLANHVFCFGEGQLA